MNLNSGINSEFEQKQVNQLKMPQSAVLIPSEVIAEADAYEGIITQDMVFIAYIPMFINNSPIYNDDYKYYVIGKFRDLPIRIIDDFYKFIIFKTIEECELCLGELGYSITPYFENYKIFFSNGDTPMKLIEKVKNSKYEPILKLTLRGGERWLFGYEHFIQPSSFMKKYDQNQTVEGYESENENCYSSDFEYEYPSVVTYETPRVQEDGYSSDEYLSEDEDDEDKADDKADPKYNRQDFINMIGLKSIGINLFDEHIDKMKMKWILKMAKGISHVPINIWELLADRGLFSIFKQERYKIKFPSGKTIKLKCAKTIYHQHFHQK